METATIICIRQGRAFKTFLCALILICAFLLVLYLVQSPILQIWMNPLSLVVFSIFGIFFLIGFVMFIDRKPLLVVSKERLWVRSSRLPFSRLQEINWNEIARYRLRIFHAIRFGTTRTLVIELNSNDKQYFLDLGDIKTDENELLAALQSHTPNAAFIEEKIGVDE